MERTALNVLLYPEKSLSIHLSNLPYEGNWSGVTIAILQMREGRWWLAYGPQTRYGHDRSRIKTRIAYSQPWFWKIKLSRTYHSLNVLNKLEFSSPLFLNKTHCHSAHHHQLFPERLSKTPYQTAQPPLGPFSPISTHLLELSFKIQIWVIPSPPSPTSWPIAVSLFFFFF